MLACVLVVRNQRVLASFEARLADDERRVADDERRVADDERRVAQGLAPKTRRRRRTTIADLVGAGANAPP